MQDGTRLTEAISKQLDAVPLRIERTATGYQLLQNTNNGTAFQLATVDETGRIQDAQPIDYADIPSALNFRSPILQDISKSRSRDATIFFTVDDFNRAFSDPDGNSLTTVRISSLPSRDSGILKLSELVVTEGQEILVSNLGKLSFQPTAQFKGGVIFQWNGFDSDSYADNAAQVNLLDDDLPPSGVTLPTLTNSADDVFTISSGAGKANLQVTLVSSNSERVNELGAFPIDDDKGTINGIALGDAGYAQAALDRAKVVFSTLFNLPSGFSQDESTSLVEFNSGDRLRFFLVKNSTVDSVRSGMTPLSEVLFSQPSTQKIEFLGNGTYSIAWEDSQGNSVVDFQDLVVRAIATSQELSLRCCYSSKFSRRID